MSFAERTLKDGPASKALHAPVRSERYVLPEKLEEIMEEEVWQE